MNARSPPKRAWMRVPGRLAAREAPRLSIVPPRRGSATLLVQATNGLSTKIDMKDKKSDAMVEYYSIGKQGVA